MLSQYQPPTKLFAIILLSCAFSITLLNWCVLYVPGFQQNRDEYAKQTELNIRLAMMSHSINLSSSCHPRKYLPIIRLYSHRKQQKKQRRRQTTQEKQKRATNLILFWLQRVALTSNVFDNLQHILFALSFHMNSYENLLRTKWNVFFTQAHLFHTFKLIRVDGYFYQYDFDCC